MTTLLDNAMVHTATSDGGARSEPLSAVGIGLDRETQRFLQLFAESSPLMRLREGVDDYFPDEQEPLPKALADSPEVCIVDFDGNRHSAALVAGRVHAQAPETAIFAVSSRSEPNCIIEAMRSGCTEYLVKPVSQEQMLSALQRAVGARRDRKESVKSKVVVLLGAKGGCGVTTLVTQLGTLLARAHPRRVLLLDLHSDFGDAALYLGLRSYRYHCYELLENVFRLDAELLQSFVLHHPSGLEVIPAPEIAEPARRVERGALTQTLDFLRSRYEFILVDSPPGLGPENVELLRYCDRVYLVTVPEVAAVRNVARHVNYFTQQDLPPDQFQVVLNRHQKRSPISDAQIEKAIGRPLAWKVPNQYLDMINMITAGAPAPELDGSELRQRLTDWADSLDGTSPDGKPEKRGILGLWKR